MTAIPPVSRLKNPQHELARKAVLAPREMLRTVNWWRGGRCGPAPAALKRGRIARTARAHEAGTIVETGTYLGHTTAYLAARGFTVHTIELSPELAERVGVASARHRTCASGKATVGRSSRRTAVRQGRGRILARWPLQRRETVRGKVDTPDPG